MKLFTLLHISQQETSTHNNRAKNFAEQIKVYVNCIRLLYNTLLQEGIEIELLTNDREYIVSLIGEPFINITELSFTMNVPSGLKFYSAHYKIEVYKFLSTYPDPYVGIIDNDIICVNAMPECLKNCISDQLPLYYDVSNQVFPAYGQEKILAEKVLISPTNRLGLWAGGEFIMGPPHFFAELYDEISLIKESYFKNAHLLHHQSDEFLSSIAIENYMLKNDSLIMDAGILNIVGRYWSFPIKHQQRNIDEFLKCFLLHLPNDKKFLSSISHKTLNRNELVKTLRQEMSVIVLLNSVKYRIQKLLRLH
jgi:hypothetical protein